MSSRETPRHSTHVMVPFSRAPLNLTSALFIVVLFRFWRFRRSFFPRYAWRVRESFYWTRGTTPTHIPRTPRLAWLSPFSLSDWVANGSSIVLAVQHLLPSPPPPPPAPASTSRVPTSLLRVLFRRQGCLRAAHCILYLASIDFDGTVFSALQVALTPRVAKAAFREGMEGSPGWWQRRHVPGSNVGYALIESLLVSPRPPSRMGRCVRMCIY